MLAIGRVSDRCISRQQQAVYYEPILWYTTITKQCILDAAVERYMMKAKQTISVAEQNKRNLRNIYGTFAVEGMEISQSTRRDLDRIAGRQVSCQDVLQELRAKHSKWGDHVFRI